jgi:hypothetical protein
MSVVVALHFNYIYELQSWTQNFRSQTICIFEKKNITEKVNQLKFRCQLREWCNLTNGEKECFNFYYKFSLFFVAALFYVQYFGSVRTYYLSNKHLKKQLDCGQNLLAYSLRLMVNATTLIFNKISCERLIIYSYKDKMSKY